MRSTLIHISPKCPPTSVAPATLGVLTCAFAALFSGAAHAQVPFTEEAVARGINYQMQPSPPVNGFYGQACAAADLDGDGDQDVILLGRVNGQVGIFENVGNGQFINRSTTSGIGNIPSASGVATADYDGDGRMDIFITRTDGVGDRLYRGLGGFTWTNVTFSSGIDTSGRLSKACAWGDYDNDGWVDLYIGNYVIPTRDLTVNENQLYRNRGDGTFEDVGPLLGVNSRGATLQPMWTDVDRDGWLDLYLSNDRGSGQGSIPNQLWHNAGGTFVDITQTSGAGVALNSMGLACGDWNRDGLPDFYCTNTVPTNPSSGIGFPLLLSAGTNLWQQAQIPWGVAYPSAPMPGGDGTAGWGCMFFDWDNDGWQDLYVCILLQPNKLYQGGPNPPALNVAAAAGMTGTQGMEEYGCAFLDVDGDGDLDVLLNPMGQTVHLYINHEGETRSWVRFRIKGRGPNTAAIGAAVEGHSGKDVWYQEILAGGNNYLGQNEQVVHFGLGARTSLDSATVRWPSGGPQRSLSSIPAGTVWTLYPPEALGDADHDGDVDAQDRALLCAWLGTAVVAGHEMMDFDGNWVINGADAAAFSQAFNHVAADQNGDGHVDGADLGIMLANWNTSNCISDINGDGQVDGGDLGVLLSNWS